jgi:hypothetical protein
VPLPAALEVPRRLAVTREVDDAAQAPYLARL